MSFAAADGENDPSQISKETKRHIGESAEKQPASKSNITTTSNKQYCSIAVCPPHPTLPLAVRVCWCSFRITSIPTRLNCPNRCSKRRWLSPPDLPIPSLYSPISPPRTQWRPPRRRQFTPSNMGKPLCIQQSDQERSPLKSTRLKPLNSSMV